MKFILSPPRTIAEELAFDEALLDTAEAAPDRFEAIRLWEIDSPAVVIGRASKFAEEADVAACERDCVPIVRRCSGGCAVVVGRGCLLYSIVMHMEHRPELQAIDAIHRFVLERVAAAIGSLGVAASLAGTSDLTHDLRKFSGNSLRVKRTHFLYHGTLLYDFDLSLVAKYLKHPPREPEYRAGRDHARFVANLGMDRERLTAALRSSFAAEEETHPEASLLERFERLMVERYSLDEWHRSR